MHLLFLHNIQIIDGENTCSVASLGWTLRSAGRLLTAAAYHKLKGQI
jgi:hypothetical protein